MQEKTKTVKVSISIEKRQLEWLNKNNFNLSNLTREYLKEFISSMKKTKNIAVPAWFKMADKESMKSRANKNPLIKKLVKD